MNLSAPRTGHAATRCPYCSGPRIVRKGVRKKKLEIIQLWRCNDCEKVFTPRSAPNKTFPLPIILEAITLHNIGHSAEAACRLIKEKNGISVAPSSLNRWLQEHHTLCTYERLRDRGRILYTPHQIIRSVKLYHQQVYEFSIHCAKLDLLVGTGYATPLQFRLLADYLVSMLKDCPHELFRTTQRASQAKAKTRFDLDQASITSKQNFATRIAQLVLPSAPSNKLRHETLQRFMLVND